MVKMMEPDVTDHEFLSTRCGFWSISVTLFFGVSRWLRSKRARMMCRSGVERVAMWCHNCKTDSCPSLLKDVPSPRHAGHDQILSVTHISTHQ